MAGRIESFCRAVVLLLAVTLAVPAFAQSEKKPADPDAWRFDATLYGWMMSVGGNVTTRGHTIDTNASFIDLVQKSQSLIGFMGCFEADKGPAGMYLDVVYTNLSFGASNTSYRNPVAGLKITTTTSAALTYQLFVAEIGGTYEVYRWGPQTALDGVMGFRYWNNSVDASFDAAANVDFTRLHLDRSFGLAVARADAIQWVDPVVGVRLRHHFTPNQQLVARFDVGGFGLGSQFSWQALAAYSYAWQLDGGQQLAAMVGFRALGVNYSSGSGVDAVGINETLYGPVIGMSFRF